jgi:hypothetical protein
MRKRKRLCIVNKDYQYRLKLVAHLKAADFLVKQTVGCEGINKCPLVQKTKQEMCEYAGIPYSAVKKCLDALCKADIIAYNRYDGVFINPEYVYLSADDSGKKEAINEYINFKNKTV